MRRRWAQLRAYLDMNSVPQPWTVDRGGQVRLLGAALVAALGAAALGLAGGYHAGFAALNGAGASVAPRLLQSLTYLGDSLTVLVGLLLFGAHRREAAWTGFIAALIATLASRIPKAIFNASRPPGVLDGTDLFVSGPAFTSHSFPSGHTVSIFVGVAVFLYFARSPVWRWGPVALAAMVGASRVMAGVHWPVDVLAGAAIGLVSMALAAPIAVATQRGIGARVQAGLAVVLAACAVALIVHRPDYPLAWPMAVLLGVGGLAAFAWHFLLAPGRSSGAIARVTR